MICSDDTGDPIIIWRDRRDDLNGDIYAQRIDYLSGIIGGGGEPIIPFGSYYLLFMAIGIISVIIYTKHRLRKIN